MNGRGQSLADSAHCCRILEIGFLLSGATCCSHEFQICGLWEFSCDWSSPDPPTPTLVTQLFFGKLIFFRNSWKISPVSSGENSGISRFLVSSGQQSGLQPVWTITAGQKLSMHVVALTFFVFGNNKLFESFLISNHSWWRWWRHPFAEAAHHPFPFSPPPTRLPWWPCSHLQINISSQADMLLRSHALLTDILARCKSFPFFHPVAN